MLQREFQAATAKAAAPLLQAKVEPNVFFNQRIGNMYTPSMYAQLIALLARHHQEGAAPELHSKRVLAYSYGSGSAAAVYSIRFALDSPAQLKLFAQLQQCAKAAEQRLDRRLQTSPELYTEVSCIPSVSVRFWV